MKTRELTPGEEIINAILHGVGLGLAIAALVVLIVLGNVYGDVWHVTGFTIYGSTLVILYLSSTLYHAVPKGKAKDIFRILDHSAVFLLIAGTYTPLALIALRGPLGWTIFGIVWGITVLGIVFKVLFVKRFVIFSTLLYVLMGWLVVFFMQPLVEAISTTSLVFLVVGGGLYTVGTIFYAMHKMKYNHAIWHLFVLAGSICHFFTVLYLLPR